MTLVIAANAILGLILLTVVLTLLAGAIRRSHIDHRLVLVARRRQIRERRHAAARPRSNWAARPDAF